MTSQCGDSGMVRMCRLPRRIMIIMMMMIVRKTVELSINLLQSLTVNGEGPYKCFHNYPLTDSAPLVLGIYFYDTSHFAKRDMKLGCLSTKFITGWLVSKDF